MLFIVVMLRSSVTCKRRWKSMPHSVLRSVQALFHSLPVATVSPMVGCRVSASSGLIHAPKLYVCLLNERTERFALSASSCQYDTSPAKSALTHHFFASSCHSPKTALPSESSIVFIFVVCQTEFDHERAGKHVRERPCRHHIEVAAGQVRAVRTYHAVDDAPLEQFEVARFKVAPVP